MIRVDQETKKATRGWVFALDSGLELVPDSNAKLLSWCQLSPGERARRIPTLHTITVLQYVSTVKDYLEGAILSIA